MNREDYAKAINSIEYAGLYLVGLEQDNAQMEQTIAGQETFIKDLQTEIRQILTQPAISADVSTLLDLLEPDIARSEKLILHDQRLVNLIAAYRKVRPGGDK